MPSFLQIENISKSYGTKVLFENIRFNINEGDKIALIAPNGTGKTSLLRIISGKDKSDSNGKILFLKDIRIAFLEQEYDFDPQKTVFRQIMDDSLEYTSALDPEGMDQYGLRVRRILTEFSLGDGSQRMDSLSGGEVKRVAITRMLASEADFLIMDEPTNHLDIDAIEYLEQTLNHSRSTLLMVTHDRYFLDSICNTVMELDRGALYTYRGGYMDFLEKRQERIDNYNAETEKVRNVLRRELEWMRSTPQARTGKARYRKQAFEVLKERSEAVRIEKNVDMALLRQDSTYLGNKVVNCRHLSFSWEGKCYLNDFTYNFQRYDRIGIVGRNASGKTTFMNLLAGLWNPSMGGELSGEIEVGSSVKTGYYRQQGIVFREDQTVLETVGDTRLLNRFLFPHEMFDSKVGTLSGGEKRRLYLITVLMQQPNLLILDEPTNDLDIVTLGILEEYLLEFKGSLIIVSHDRHFLDRLVNHLFVFTGDGHVKDFVGDYSDYRAYMKELDAQRKAQQRSSRETPVQKPREKKPKLSWKEQREMETLETEIESLEKEKAELEATLQGGEASTEEIVSASTRYGEVCSILEEKEFRWLELSEKL